MFHINKADAETTLSNSGVSLLPKPFFESITLFDYAQFLPAFLPNLSLLTDPVVKNEVVVLHS